MFQNFFLMNKNQIIQTLEEFYLHSNVDILIVNLGFSPDYNYLLDFIPGFR